MILGGETYYHVQADDIPLVENEYPEEILRYVSTNMSNLERVETLAILLKESKRYNLDLAPKLVPCRGELIELLISSGVGRYLEFKAMDKTYVYSVDAFYKVPCSKEDVFTNQSISLIDYTNLPDTYKDYEENSFVTFLTEKFKVEGKLLLAVLYAIALIRTDTMMVNISDLSYIALDFF
ncbi:8261_t:CDS:2, partial [Scutellospora calospora]